MIEVRKFNEREEAWFRLAVLIVSGVILYFWGFFALILGIVNWISTLVNKKRDKDLAEMVELWNSTTYQFYRYLSGMTNQRPFPFGLLNRMSKFEK